jgi:hypothetical protein
MVTLIVRSYKIHKTQMYSYKFIYMHIKLHKINKTLNHNWNTYVNLNTLAWEFEAIWKWNKGRMRETIFYEMDASIIFKLQKDLSVHRWSQT